METLNEDSSNGGGTACSILGGARGIEITKHGGGYSDDADIADHDFTGLASGVGEVAGVVVELLLPLNLEGDREFFPLRVVRFDMDCCLSLNCF